MAAATVNDVNVNNKSFQRKLNHVSNARFGAPNKPNGLFYFDTGDRSIAATSGDDTNDEFFVLTFPANTRLLALQYSSSDRDTGAAMVEDVIVENAAGTEVVLINDTQTGRGSASDELDLGGSHFGRDVSGMKLGLKVVTAGSSAAAGTVRFKGVVLIGEDSYSNVKF